VQAPLAAYLEFEVLDRVGDEHVLAVDASFRDGLVEYAAGGPDKGLALDVLDRPAARPPS
jgi:hypothetical protein